MKQSDIASLILIVAISFLVAYFIGNSVFNAPENRSTQVEVITPIEGEMPQPSPDVFNKNSVNPTQDIRIGGSNKDKPFEN